MMNITDRTTLLSALRTAAVAEQSLLAADSDVDTWGIPEAERARRLTAAVGMVWDFSTWADALENAEYGRLGGIATVPICTQHSVCLVCGLEGDRLVPEDEGSEHQVAVDACPRCGNLGVRPV